MNLSLLKPGFRRMVKRPVQSLMFAGGIALGSFLFSMTSIINETAEVSLQKGVEVIAGKTDLVVTQNEFGFPEDVLEKLRDLEVVEHAVPLILTRVLFKNKEGKNESLMVFGVDFFIESSVRSYDDGARSVVKDPLEFISQPDSISVPVLFAKRNHFTIGSTFQLMTTQGLKTFTIRSLMEGQDIGKSFGSGFAVMDIEAARLAFGKSEKLDRIDLQIQQGADLRKVASQIKESLGPTFDVDVPAGQVDVFQKSLSAFQKMTTFLSGLVFFVAFFLVVISVTHGVIERKTEVGILRSLGVTKVEIFSILFLENTLLATLGSLLGVLCCFGVSTALKETAQSAISTLIGLPLILSEIDWSLKKILWLIFSGVAVANAAALIPILRLTQVPVVQAIRQSGAEDGTLKKLRLPLFIGIGALTLSGVLQVISFVTGSVTGSGYQTLLIFLASVMLGPWLVLQLLSLLERLFAETSPASLRLAFTHGARGHRSTQLIVISLIFGMMILTILSIVSSSFLAAVDARMADASSPNIYISSNGSLTTNQLQPLDYRLRDQIAQIPGAEGTFGQRISRIRYKNRPINIRAVDEIPPISFTRPYSYLNVTDRDVEAAGHELYHQEGLPLMVNETFVQLFQLKTGDTFTVDTARGPVQAKIVGVISDLFGGGGSFFLSLEKYRFYWGDPLVSGFGVFVKPGTNVEEVRSRISEKFADLGLVASTRADVSRDGHATIQKGFAYLKVIEWVLATVGLLGFLNTFLIEVSSRLRVIATIRTLGMTSAEVLWAILFEGALIGAVGVFVSMLLGWIVSFYFLKFSLGPQYGWIIPQQTNWFVLCSLGVGMFVIVTLISIYPARRASKLLIKSALSAD